MKQCRRYMSKNGDMSGAESSKKSVSRESPIQGDRSRNERNGK